MLYLLFLFRHTCGDDMEIKDYTQNQSVFYYVLYEGEKEQYDDEGYIIGEPQPTYSNPKKAEAMISANTSDVVPLPFGKDLQYDKMISTVQNLPIDEHSMLYIDVVPLIDEDDGTTTTKPDYEVVKVAKGLYQNVWAIKRVEGYEND